MDFTTPLTIQGYTEDSACFPTEATPDAFSNHYKETPKNNASNLASRKRKLYASKPVLDNPSETSSGFVSGTTNEFSSWKDSDFSSKIDVSEYPVKRPKQEDESEFRPKTRSAPTTPTKHFDDSDSHIQKCRSVDLASYQQWTPRKRTRLGSEERLQLLYPNLKQTPSPVKIRTPERLREFIKCINAPAKKRLFDNPFENRAKKYETDPIVVFTMKNNCGHIVTKIFEYLSIADLCSMIRVSRTWKRAVLSDYKAYWRYSEYSQKFQINKENFTPSTSVCKELSPFDSEHDLFSKYRRLASQLTPDQSLHKCPKCLKPAVIEKSISQCQNLCCGYIHCVKCLSCSSTGPENFLDKCNTSEFVLEKRRKAGGLQDMSNLESELPLFLMSEGKSSQTPSSRCNSGYVSEMEISPIVKQRKFLTKVDQNTLRGLKSTRCVQGKCWKSPLLTAVTFCSSTPKIPELPEPSSPPRINATIAGSKQSKKNLKRLKF